MRLFVAVNPPTHLRRELSTRLDAVRGDVAVAWTLPERWHLTLMFLGEWPAARLPSLAAGLREAVAPRNPFPIQPGNLGAFPSLRRPRVLFLHLDGGEPLQALAQDVRRAVDTIWSGGPQDRKDFRPHLTLARVRQPLTAPELGCLADLDLGPWEPFRVTEALLEASTLGPDRARHVTQAILPLRGGAKK